MEILLSRDLDCLIGGREVSAVNKWMNSGKLIHSMRDHPDHSIPLLGGTWGARIYNQGTRIQWQKSWKKILNNTIAYSPRNAKGPDQTLLHYVWEWGSDVAVQHDSFSCHKFPKSIGFPTQRKPEKNGNFVGGRSFLRKECPISCRRKGHPEWTFC